MSITGGGYTGTNPERATSPEQYPGVWELPEQFQAQADGNWPFQETDCAPKSLRFDSASSAELSRTPPVASNTKTWTWSGWVKRGKLGVDSTFFGAFFGQSSRYYYARFDSNDCLDIFSGNLTTGGSATTNHWFVTNAKYRDPSAFYHICITLNTTASVEAERFSLAVNGVKVDSFSQATYPGQNSDAFVNSANEHFIGQWGNNNQYFDGLISEVHFIDGQALSCDEFGFFDEVGIWQPKRFTGDYATGGTANTTDDVYAWGLTFDNVTGGGGWYFTTEDNASSLGLSGNTGGHADELGGNTIGQRNGEDTAGAWGTIATLNGYNAGQSARSMSTNSDMGTTGNPGGPISFVWNRTNGKVWVIGNGDSTPIGGGDPSNPSSTPTFLLPTTGKVAFGFVSGNSNEEVTLQAISSSLFSGSHTLPKWRGVYDHTLSNNNATSTASLGGYRDVWSDELNDNGIAPSVGLNSFRLDFSDNSSASALAKDKSGRGNDWTAYNIFSTVHEIASPNNPGWNNSGSNWSFSNQDSNSRYQNADYSGSSSYSAIYSNALANNTTYHFFLEQYAGNGDSYGGWFISDGTNVSSTVPDELGNNTLGLRVGENGLGVHGTYATANNVSGGQDAITGFDSIRANTSTGAATFAEFVINTTVDKVWVRPVGGDWIGGGDPSNTSSAASFSLIASNPQYFGYMAYTSGTYAHITPTAGNPSDVDCLVDSPVNGNEASTGAGAERRGNHASWNPLIFQDSGSGVVLSNGNLDAAHGSSDAWASTGSTIAAKSGKYYAEFTVAGSSQSNLMIGVNETFGVGTSYMSTVAMGDGFCIQGDTTIRSRTFTTAANTLAQGAWSAGDVISIAIDLDAGKAWTAKNGSWDFSTVSGNAFDSSNPTATWTDLTKYYLFAVSNYSNDNVTSANFGQRSWKYSAPTGFSPLATSFLPEPTIKRPNEAFDVKTFSANNASQPISLGFSPDLVWTKSRDHSVEGQIFDKVRGNNQEMSPNAARIDRTLANSLTLDSSGFTMPSNNNNANWTSGSGGGVGWAWDAGEATTTIAVGSLNSSVYNQDKNWSGYTKTGSYPGGATWSEAFNGNLVDGVYTDTNVTGTLTIDVADRPTWSNKIRIYGVRYGSGLIKINGTDVSSSVSNSVGWYDLSSTLGSSGTLESFEIDNPGGNYGKINAVELDGRLLVDSINDSQTWSSSLTSSTGFRGSEPATNAFDGSVSTVCSAVGQGTVTYTSPVAVPSGSTIEVYVNGGDHTVSVNGGSNQTVSAGSFKTLQYTNPTTTPFTLAITRNTNADTGIKAIKIGGKVLVNPGQNIAPNVPSIASTVRANPSAGFSITSWIGTDANGEIAHGLNAAPKMIWLKNRDSVEHWQVFHTDIPNNTFLSLSDTGFNYTNPDVWNSTDPTSSVFSFNSSVNLLDDNFIAYCFAPRDGYSAVGVYKATNDASGSFVWTGMRPKFVMIKCSTGNESWVIYDSVRGPTNHNGLFLRIDANNEGSGSEALAIDMLSNGFKPRGQWGSINDTNTTDEYIWIAFAEHPFASQARAR